MPAPRFRPPEVDKAKFARLQRKDCNKARVYVVWTRVFQQDCTVTALHRYLAANYEWTPTYQTLRGWMPEILAA